MGNTNFEDNYEIAEEGQHIIDEKGNSYLMLAKYKWFGKGDFKLGIRTFYSTSEKERIGKGISFLTEEGPHELTKVLLEEGYGHPQELAQTIRKYRPEVIGAVMDELNTMTKDEKNMCEDAYVNCDDFSDNDDEMYNPEDLLNDEL